MLGPVEVAAMATLTLAGVGMFWTLVRHGSPESVRAALDRVEGKLEDVLEELSDVRTRLPRRIAGRYDLHHRIGEGGAGVVWRAVDAATGRQCAVKLLHPHLDDELKRGRFLREASVAKEIDHPNVVATLDSGEDQGELYLVMQFVQGRTLREVLRARTTHDPDSLLLVDVGVSICSALRAAAAKKIVHRDIKPENIMVDSDGCVMLTDFGLGFIDSSTSAAFRLTKEGVASGTPHYMSPEQVRGADITSATDIYALGCVLYEIASGAPPFTGNAPSAVMLRQLNDPRPSLPGPPILSTLLIEMMALDPSDRPSVDEVENVLRGLVGRTL